MSRPRRPLPRAVWLATGATLLAATADAFLLFALFWIAGPQGWSGLETAVVVLALRVPALIGGVLGGRAVDRLGGRPLILLDVGGRAVLLAALAVAGWGGRLPLAAVLVIGALAGALMPLSYAGARWLVPRIVEPDDLPRANVALALGEQLPFLAGAAVLAPTLALLGPGRGMLVPAAMLALATALALRLPCEEVVAPLPPLAGAGGDPPPNAPSPWRTPRILTLVALSVAYYCAYGPFETALPAFVRRELGGDETAYGVLWILFGAGALATLPLAPALARSRPGVVNAAGAILWGVAMLPLAFTGELWLAGAIFLVGGAIWGPYSAVEATALHRWVDPAQHGRVFGTQRAVLYTATPLGAALGAVALDHASSAAILGGSAAACATAGLLALCRRDLRAATGSPSGRPATR